MGRRNDHSREELREMIIGEARKLLGQHGQAGLKVRPIMQAIGYATGTFYNLFPSLGSLVLEINGQTLDQISSGMQTLLIEHDGREPAIYALARSYLEFSRDLFPFWNLLLEYQVDEEGLPAWYEEKVDAAFQLIESAIARDFNVSGPELKRSARVLWAALHGITTLSHRGKLATTESEPAEVLCQSLLQTYFSGLRTLYGEAKT